MHLMEYLLRQSEAITTFILILHTVLVYSLKMTKCISFEPI